MIVNDTTSANLRWANNTLTTNGVMHAIDVTVIAFQGAGNASVSGTAASPEQVAALVESADRAAALADAAEDRAELVAGDAARDWDDPPGETSIQVFEAFAAQLGEAFSQADAEKRILYGFVFHEVTTTYLGSSTGLRLRHVQPTGHYGCTGKNTELTNSAWVGGATRDFADVDAVADGGRPGDPARLGRAPHRPARGSLRHDPAPDRGRGHDDRRLLERRRPQRRRRPDGLLQAGWWHPDRRATMVNPGVRLYSDPAYAGLECAPVRDRRRLVGPQQRLRQRRRPGQPPTGSPTVGSPR